MGKAYYRIGQAAKILGVSSHHLRRLCELGMIEAEFSGHQWQILVSAVEAMQQAGVPPIPGEIGVRKTNGNHPDPRLLAAPSPTATGSAEAALMSEHELTVARNRLERRKLEQEENEITDAFAERERQAETKKERQQMQIQMEQRTAAGRRRWEERKNEHFARAMRQRPWDIPKEADLDVGREVSSILQNLTANDDDSFVRRQVDAAVAKALAPWNELRDTEYAIREACDNLSVPYRLSRDDIRNTARLAAREAINHLPAGSRREEKIAAAKQAASRLQREAERTDHVQAILRNGLGLHGATPQEEDQARAAVRKALAGLSDDATEGEMERSADQAVKPIRAAVESRQDGSMREHVMMMAGWGLRLPEETKQRALAEVDEALREMPRGTPQRKLEAARDAIIERIQRKSQLVESGVREIYSYLLRLRSERRLKGNDGLMTLDSKLQAKIRPMLERELNSDETMDDVLKLVHRAVREALGIPPNKSR